MSQQQLIHLFQELAEKLPNQTVADVEHQHRLVEIIESLEAQASSGDSSAKSNPQSNEYNDMLNQIMLEYQSEHPKSMAILKAIQKTLAQTF